MGVTDAGSAWVTGAEPMSPNASSGSFRKLLLKCPAHEDRSFELMRQWLRKHRQEKKKLNETNQEKTELLNILTSLKDVISAAEGCAPKMKHLVNDGSGQMLSQRNRAAKDVRCLSTIYGYQPEDFMLAIDLMDHFITKVKVASKYVPCTALACFLLSTTVKHDEEAAPVTQRPTPAQLLQLCNCTGCSVADLERMRTIIATKLVEKHNADNALPRYLVLQHIHGALQACFPAVFSHASLRGMTSVMATAFCRGELLLARPSVLSLAVVSYTLDDLGLSRNPSVSSLFILLRNACNVADAELRECQSKMAAHLFDRRQRVAELRYNTSLQLVRPRRKALLRPSSCQGLTVLPVIPEVL